jgi:hypothetical protein
VYIRWLEMCVTSCRIVNQPLEGLLAKICLVQKKTEEEDKVGWCDLYLVMRLCCCCCKCVC